MTEQNIFQIELARQEQLAELADIELAAAELFPEGHIPEDQKGHSFPLKELRKAFDQELLFCANANSHTVGFASCHQYKHYLHLDEISVDPQYGRQGIGRALVEKVIEASKLKQLKGITLCTFSDIPWNAPFYQSMGFEILEEQDTPRHVQAMLREEKSIGLNNRVAMRLKY